jgi:hypothetical protein
MTGAVLGSRPKTAFRTSTSSERPGPESRRCWRTWRRKIWRTVVASHSSILVPEAFETGRAPISAAVLEARLPATLEAAERRKREVYEETDAEAIERVLKSYRDFVALCGRMERATGVPCTIIASY